MKISSLGGQSIIYNKQKKNISHLSAPNFKLCYKSASKTFYR